MNKNVIEERWHRRAVLWRGTAVLALWCFGSAIAALAQTQLKFYAVYPCRIADTRKPDGPTGGPALAHDAWRDFPVRKHCGVPDAAIVGVLNLTIVGPPAGGHLIVVPLNTGYQGTSTMNFTSADVTLANGVMMLLGANPPNESNISIKPQMNGGGALHLLIDVIGYFAP